MIALRLAKEHDYYKKEEEEQKKKLEKFIADNAEDWDIKNAVSDDTISYYSSGPFAALALTNSLDRCSLPYCAHRSFTSKRNMLQESEKMIGDTSNRLEKATLDLRDIVVSSNRPLPPCASSSVV